MLLLSCEQKNEQYPDRWRIGGFLASTLLNMPNALKGINVTSILVAFVGAVILIAILRAVCGPQTTNVSMNS